MSTLESQTVGYGQGFAITEHERGIAIVRCSARGLRLSISSDGVTWTQETVKGAGAAALQPVCSGGGVSGADLFCADASGRLVPLSTRGGSVALGRPFQPVAGAPDWYESTPQPYEQTIIHDARNNLYRIPIERAMELEAGDPWRRSQPPPTPPPTGEAESAP